VGSIQNRPLSPQVRGRYSLLDFIRYNKENVNFESGPINGSLSKRRN